jgi:hypothetical protein
LPPYYTLFHNTYHSNYTFINHILYSSLSSFLMSSGRSLTLLDPHPVVKAGVAIIHSGALGGQRPEGRRIPGLAASGGTQSPPLNCCSWVCSRPPGRFMWPEDDVDMETAIWPSRRPLMHLQLGHPRIPSERNASHCTTQAAGTQSPAAGSAPGYTPRLSADYGGRRQIWCGCQHRRTGRPS